MKEEDIVESSINRITLNLKNVKPQIRRDLDFRKIPGIRKAGSEVKHYIERINTNETKDDDIIIGGSTAANAQINKFRKPKDIDIHTKRMKKAAFDIAEIMKKKYGVKNIDVSPVKILVLGNTQTKIIQIKVKTKSGLKDAIDIKSMSDSNMPFMDFSLSSITVVEKNVRIGNLLYETVGSLAKKKGQVIRDQYIKNIRNGIEPLSRTKKDIDDFISMAEAYQERKSIKSDLDKMKDNLRFYSKIPSKKTDEVTRKKMKELEDPFGISGFL